MTNSEKIKLIIEFVEWFDLQPFEDKDDEPLKLATDFLSSERKKV